MELKSVSVYWDEAIETMPRERLEQLQLARLRETLARALKAPAYAQRFKQIGLEPDDIKSLADVRKLPFTTKQDLRDHFPYGFLAVPQEKVVRLHHSSGSTGKAIAVFHTQQDLDNWTDLVARACWMTGMRPTDVFQNMMGYGLFTGGLGLHYGAEKLGALVIPASSGNTERQLYLMQTFGTTAVHILPSYALRLARVAAEAGIDVHKDLQLTRAFIGAEPHTEATRRKIEEALDLEAYNSYGMSEMCGPGVAFECPEKAGMHLWEDAYLMELVDPDTDEPVPDGEPGELVMTTLTREAMPLIRYRVGDITRILPGECPCGRTARRLDRITGRTDDMVIVKGVNLFPMQIERVLMDTPGVGSNYLIILETKDYMDELIVQVEVQEEFFTGDLADLERLRSELTESLRSDLLVTPVVQLVEPDSLPVTEGKAKRLIDHREK